MATCLTAGFATPAEGPVSQPPVVSPHEVRDNTAKDEAGAAAVVPAPAAATAAAEPLVRSLLSLFSPFFLSFFPPRFSLSR